MGALFYIILVVVVFALGGAAGSLFTYSKLRAKITAQVRLEDRERRNLPQVHRLLTGQIWWFPGVGRCEVNAIYNAIEQVAVGVPDPKSSTRFYSARKYISLDLKSFMEKATFLAVYDGGPEFPPPSSGDPALEDRAAMEAALREVDSAGTRPKGEVEAPEISKIKAIAANAPAGTIDQRWEWATQKLSRENPSEGPKEKLALPFL